MDDLHASLYRIFVFAFTCGQNLFPCFNELRSNTQARMNSVIGISIGSATVIYEIIALAGVRTVCIIFLRETCLTCARSIPSLQYLTFGSNVASNILVNYPHSSLFVAIGRLGIVIMVSFSYPLQVHPCRAALDKVIAALTSSEDDEELEGRDGEDASGIVVRKAKEMSRTMFLSLTSAIVILGLIVALLVDELETGKCRPPSPAYSIQVN
jgi:amino acid permease